MATAAIASIPHLTLSPTLRPHPLLLYGTAWKKERTAGLVVTALTAGFQGIDTACQPKHYREDHVGAGLTSFLTATATTTTPRSSLFLQTKFTSPSGQDAASCPYPPSAALQEQVTTSIQTSLRNLHTPYLDAVLLHSPLSTPAATLTTWRVLETFVQSGTILHLGISNVALPELEELYASATVKPSIVQNRFYAATGYDRAVRAFCRQRGLVWQSFWTLTANPGLLRSAVVGRVAARVLRNEGRREEALYLLVVALGRGWENGGGVAILDGTTREMGMKGDLEAVARAVEVSEAELEEFRELIGEDG